MTQATVNGHLYSDDGTAARDMLNGGAKTWLIPLAADMVAEAAGAASSATAAAASATEAAASSATLSGTSTSPLTMGLGALSLTTQGGKQFDAGQFLRIQRMSAPTIYVYGRATAYNSTTGALTLNVERFAGTGTYADWKIYVTSMAGDAGTSGTSLVTHRSIVGADTIIASDNFSFLHLSGSFTLAFAAVATLGATFSTFAKNEGTSNITLDPNGLESIDGALTKTLFPGQCLWIKCDGTKLMSTTLEWGTAGVFHAVDQKASGTQGGSSSTGWQTRILNTVLSNTLEGASLASNAVTLPAGTYEVQIRCPSGSGTARAALWNVTDSTYVVFGSVVSNSTVSTATAQITITAQKTFNIQFYTDSSGGISGLGNGTISDGQPQVFSSLFFRKVA